MLHLFILYAPYSLFINISILILFALLSNVAIYNNLAFAFLHIISPSNKQKQYLTKNRQMKIKGLMILASSLLILAFIHQSESASMRSLLMNNGSYEEEEQVLKYDSMGTIANSSALDSKRVIPTGPNPLHNR